MAPPKLPKLKITEKSHWCNRHSASGYTKRVRLIGDDIIQTWVEADRDVALDVMDSELLQVVITESGLLGKRFHLIFDLNHVSDLTYRYKLAITDLLFNWKPAFGVIGFYNIPQSMLIMVESFAALVPEEFNVFLGGSCEDVIEHIEAFNTGRLLSEDSVVEGISEEQVVIRRFLAAVARMSWLNMLDEEISTPEPESHYYPFFKAIDSLRMDLFEKDVEKKNEVKLLQQDFENRITQMTIKMNAQAELNKKSIHDLEKEIALLKTRIATQDMELTRVSTAIAEKTTALRDLLDQIHSLDIDSTVKRAMTDACLSLIETETIEKRLNIELTESDSYFLSRLQKKHPNLNQRELRIALLVKLNYDTVEIARSVDISTRGMESIRYRMHKKLGLGKHQSIKTYLSELAVSF